MGSTISSVAQDAMQKQQLMQMKQMKMQRDMQFASTVARIRDQLVFMTSGITCIGLGLVGQKLAGRPVRLAFIPAVVVTHVYAYLADMAYGTKMNRIKAEADRVREEGFWFNDKMQLPRQMKPVYHAMRKAALDAGGEWDDFAE
ncbi:MAG: hypothetical protein SGCHY_005403 [Lobulomycetales sp.]